MLFWLNRNVFVTSYHSSAELGWRCAEVGPASHRDWDEGESRSQWLEGSIHGKGKRMYIAENQRRRCTYREPIYFVFSTLRYTNAVRPDCFAFVPRPFSLGQFLFVASFINVFIIQRKVYCQLYCPVTAMGPSLGHLPRAHGVLRLLRRDAVRGGGWGK